MPITDDGKYSYVQCQNSQLAMSSTFTFTLDRCTMGFVIKATEGEWAASGDNAAVILPPFLFKKCYSFTYDRTTEVHLMTIHCAAAERGVLIKNK